MTDLDQVRVVVTVRAYGTPTFQTEVMHRRWAEEIFFALPHGPFRVSSVRVIPTGLVATVEVAGGWDFTGTMGYAQAFVVADELTRDGFDVASGKIVPETATGGN